MDQYELIRTAHRVYGKSIREIRREIGHHRETIRKALKGYCQVRLVSEGPSHYIEYLGVDSAPIFWGYLSL